MNQTNNNQFSFSSSFISKVFLLALGIACFALLGSGEMLAFISARIQAELFIPPALFKALLFVFGVSFFLMPFSRINVKKDTIGTSSLLVCITPIAWENIEKIEIKPMRVKKQNFFEISFSLKKGCRAERRFLWFIRHDITRWAFSWPENLKSKNMTIVQAIEKYAVAHGVQVKHKPASLV